MGHTIIEMYRKAGYSPEDTIRELSLLTGCAILAYNENSANVNNEHLNVTVTVTEK